MTDEELVRLSLGNFTDPLKDDLYKYLEIEGETPQSIKSIDTNLILVDGLAGIKIAKKYGVDEKGKYYL